MEARIAVLEEIARSTKAALDRIEGNTAALRSGIEGLRADINTGLTTTKTEIRAGLSDTRDRHDRDFRITFAAIIAVTLGLASLMAKGFHWL